MICEKNQSSLQKSCEKDYHSDEFISLELAISEINLLPTLDQGAQQALFEKIVRLCTQNPDFQLKSCQNSLLFKIIQLLNFHKNFSIQLIDKIFKTIEVLGKRSIKHIELKALIELLQPKERFPYGLQIIRCFVQWAKATSSIELHTQLLNANEQNLLDSEKLRNFDNSDRFNSKNQQAKHFFDFWEKKSGILVEGVKKWPGYGFTFYCWIKLGTRILNKRRQLYSFYNDYGQGFEAFFTPDCSCLVIGVCNKKEFTSVQIRDVDFDSFSDKNFDKWHSIAIVHAPAKGPFGYNQLYVYIDGVLRKESNFKLPNFNDLSNIRICGSCFRPVNQSSGFLTPSLTAPLTNLKNVLGFSNKNSEKLLNMASVPAGSQDLIWGASASLIGKMSSCFVLHDVLTEVQARMLHSIGPNQYAINWIDLIELSDLKTKLLFHYDAKCVTDSTCLDLSSNKIPASFSGSIVTCNNFKESLNSIGSVHIFYPLLNYLSSNQDYIELVLNEWINNSKKLKSLENAQNYQEENKIITKRSLFDDSELEQNVASLILNFMRYLIRGSIIFHDRFERNNGLSLLGFLLQKLPRKLIDINFLRICQEYVSEAKKIDNKSLLNSIYDNLIFDFRIWNKAEYEIRIGHVQYLSTIIKDDKLYFRKKYGIQFFLDVIKTYFGSQKSQLNSQTEINGNFLAESNQGMVNTVDEDDLRNLRNSLFGLIKYYAQKDTRISELNAMISFISITKSHILQAELLDILIALLEAPNSSDQLYLLLFEPHMADGLYSLFVQIDLNEITQFKILKILRILLKSKKVYEKNKSRIRLDDCGTYAGLISKMTSELSHYYLYTNCFNQNLPLELLKNFLLEENSIQNFDNLWHILSMFVFNPVQLIGDTELLIKIRIEACEEILKYLNSNPNSIQYFTHTPAWQDIICQFLCFKRKEETNTGSNLPPIVVSSSSKLSRLNDEMTNLNNDTTDWENMEISNENEKKNEVLTSTPSQIQKKNSTKETHTLNRNRSRIKKMMSSNDEYDCSKIDKEDSIYFSSPDFVSTSNNNDSKKHLEKNKRIDELYEKVLYLINKLIWESIQGSSIEDWKERFQIFSMLYRLSKDFIFIKPVETIVLRLLESSLKHCISEIKRSAPGKEHTLAIENSRELVKLIDYFVLQSKFSLSETLISKTILVLDQANAFDSRAFSFMTMSTFSSLTQSSYNNTSLDESKPLVSENSQSISSPSVVSSGLGSYGIVHDDTAETSYLGMNILINALSSSNIEICAQVSAKINTIIHSKSVLAVEEACYIIASVDKIISDCILNNDDQHYAFLIPILKSLIDKSHSLLQMTVQVPNIPCSSISPTFYEDFKEYCKSDEWRDFVNYKVLPLKEQYLAMTVTPCQMNMEIVWNSCYESSMMSIHKRNRILGESKIKFEDTIFNKWKQRKKEETLRYNNYLLELKRNNLSMRKQLHIELKYLTSEIGPWNEGVRKDYWMLSNHENRLRMRCKLVENLNFDSHFEASRLRDYSRSDHSMYTVVASKSENEAKQGPDKLSQNIPISKEAINSQINEDIVADEEFNGETKSQQVQDGNIATRKSSMSSFQAYQFKPVVTQEHYNEYSQLEEKEKIIIRSECEMITVTKVIKGRFELTNKYIYFFDTFSPFYYLEDVNGYDLSYHEYNNSNNNNSLSGYSCHDFDILNDVKIPLVQLKEVQLRRYNLRRSALEFFLINESSYLINFNKTVRNKIYSKIVSMRLPYLQSNSSFRTPSDLLRASDYTQRWINHDMSNFEYLMKLNSIAGRSYNDLSQYPIFPWILKDFSSENIDLNDDNVYRDLRKPIGVQNKKFENYVREKYELFEDPTGAMQPFHYGTHYSNSANVMHYLIRLEPFTTLHIQLQSDKFDVADRQFYSIPSSWKILYENPTDAKELIPEFFYLPEFLVNMNNFDFGQLQSNKDRVDDVALPKWAKSPEHFIYMHRKALESDYVSSHLHEWIDLIFGYKQQGIEAEKALNVFMYYSYEGAIDVDAITDPVARNATEGMISNFGQIPIQLLKEPHPKRKTLDKSIKDKIVQGKPIVLWNQIKNLKAYYVEFCDAKRDEVIDPVIFINIPRNQIKSFIQQGLSEPLITICESGVIGVNGWQAYERSTANLFSFEKDPSLSTKTKKSISNQFDPSFELNSRIFVLTNDSKLLISGAHWDNSLRVFSLSKNRNVAHLFQHSDIVISIAIDYTSSYVVSGSKDCLCMVWRVVQEYGNCVNLELSPFHIFYGHTDWVTAVDISNELDLVISGSKDGTVNIHSLQSGCYVKTLNFNNNQISYFNNVNIKLNNERHILIFTDGITMQSSTHKNKYEIFVYSINGQLISQEQLNFPVEDMIFQDKYCILGLIINQKNKTNANGSLSSSNFEENFDSKKKSESLSKIMIKDYFNLKTIHTIKLKAAITCMNLTRDESHLLVGLKDGKLIVITGDRSIK